MEKLNKERSYARSSFTKAKNNFTQAIATDPDNHSRILSYFKVFEEKAMKLFNIDESINEQWFCQDDFDEEAKLKDDDLVDTYRQDYHEIKANFEKSTAEKEGSSKGDSSSIITQINGNKYSRKLPKLELTKFDGNAKNWLGFWSSFKKIHSDDSIDDDDKMAYLIQSMTPDSPAINLVKSFPPCGENYSQAVEQLKARYGRDELLIEIYVRELLSLVLHQAKETNTMRLSTLYDKLKTQLRALEVLGVTSEKYAAMLYPLVESALPEETLRVWERQRGRGTGTDILNSLLEFVKIEVESEERIQITRKSLKVEEKAEDKVPTAACLVSGDFNRSKSPSNEATSCIWCNKTSHGSFECYKAQRMTIEARKELIAKKRACTVCLKECHNFKKCKSKTQCIGCQKRHAVLLCPKLGKTGTTSSDNAELMLTNKTNGTTLLQTLTVKIRDETLRAFIDTGAQRSYIRSDVAAKLRLCPMKEETLKHSLFGGVETKEESHQVFDLTVKSMTGKFTLNITALSKEKICGYIPRIRHESFIDQKLKQHKLKLTDIGDNTPEVGLLIGADYAGKIMTGSIIHLNEDLHAIQTKLGWTLQGMVARENDTIIATVDLYSNDINKLWNLETLGIEEPKDKLLRSRTEEEAMKEFRRNISVNSEGRYEVTLPWKLDRPELFENKELAEKRLLSTTKKLKSLKELQNYSKIFEEWLELGIIEIDPDISISGHYLPHHAVIKESSLTTRVRPVFDASAKDYNGNSINSCLETGLNFLELIPILLTRFRMHAVGVTADIKKAFLQISIAESDRKNLRFLWWDEKGNMIVYRHCRVVFGLTCSPFLLAATLIHHLEKYSLSQYSKSAALLKSSYYVDNCVASLGSIEEAEQFIEEAKQLMVKGKFDLRGWVTSPPVKDTEKQKMISVLGLTWDTETDKLQCNVSPLKACQDKVTRRELLSICNRVFDPIGFTCPTTLIPKLLLQRTWSLKVGWDTVLPEDVCREFQNWMEDIHYLAECKIPRKLTMEPLKASQVSLHTFCDASKHAYATCTFLRSETNNGVTVQLVLAKSRVTPVKEITIPRLELIAALMSTRIYVQARDALHLENCKAYFWTDSSVALTWIISDRDWSVFVKNRVHEIREVTKPEDWRHLKGTLNPADLPSRGCCAKKLADSKWWEGPDWLKESEDKWPVSPEIIVREEDITKELKKIKNVVVNSDITSTIPFTTCLTNMSKYSKIVRTVAWILRFYNNSKCSKKTSGELKLEETKKAEKTLLRVIQEESLNKKGKVNGMKDIEIYEDADGLKRVKTRLTLVEESESFKAPILLDGKHPIVERLVEQRHLQRLHAGINILFSTLGNEYWILGGKRVARKVISRCIVCKRYRSESYKTPTAPLPDNRVKDTGVFQIVGVDAAGPMILNTGEKSWMILFTCAVYRAIHIELVMSMSTECFLFALRRFIARRGRVQVMYSDNGTNFVGAENLLTNVDWKSVEEYSTVQRIKWVFNPPAAPWWGGWWEVMIRMVKNLLRRNLGKASLTFIELQTILCDIESVVNTRPLTYVTEDDTLRPLTPETFLHPLQGSEVTDLDAIDTENLNARQRYLQKLRSDLRQRFRNEYLSLLVSRSQKTNKPIQKGDVVIVETEAKRLNWPLGVVEEIFVGKDGQYRVARIKTTDGYRTRPVQRLHPLEINNNEDPVEGTSRSAPEEPVSDEGPPPPPRTTRSGRLLKVPRRLDL